MDVDAIRKRWDALPKVVACAPGSDMDALLGVVTDIPALLADRDRLVTLALDLFDRYVEVVAQGCYTGAGRLHDSAISTYEDAFEYLGLPESGCTEEEWAAAVAKKRARIDAATGPVKT